MKKILAFISCLLIASAAVFADVSVKKLDNGQIEVTFFYGNPRATEVLLAGDFTNWQDGAEPMTKGDKGFTLVKVVPAGTVMKYKFISDGNWTEDLKEPDKVDDGFGGHNGLVDVDELIAAQSGGDAAGATKKASIKFMTWSMIGGQGKFLTQGASDPTKKGMDFDNATLGFKSYNKLTGTITPNMPFYVEIALAETELDSELSGNPIYLYKKNAFNSVTNNILDAVSGLVSSPAAFLGQATDNSASDAQGPGTNPYLGHLKFGFETPWVNYTTGFNYAKQDKRAKIFWTTVDGNWDAGYQHVGGFSSFSLGNNLQNILQDTGIKLDAGFAPNKSADRKGTKYGYEAWAGMSLDNLVVDFQSNGMYNGDVIFTDPVEHDFIIGAKDKIDIDDVGSITFGAQGLVATHQKSSADLGGKVADYTGYSTDVFYRSGNFDGLQNIAAEAKVGFENAEKEWGVTVDYRMRGAQASMLFLRENHDDGTFDLSETLGLLNSMNIGVTAYLNTMWDQLKFGLDAKATLPLQYLAYDSDLVTSYYAENAWNAWYKARCGSNMEPLFGIKGGAKIVAKPSVTYIIDDDENMSVSAYGKMKYNAYVYDDAAVAAGKKAVFGASDSAFLFENAGLTFSWNNVSDVVKSMNVYYGFDNANSARLFNTLVGSVSLPADLTLTAAFGLKTVKGTEAGQAYNKDANNMIGFALGCAKKISKIQKPVIYTEFCFNMDPYKNFGDGQDQLALNGANVTDRWDGKALGGIDAVDYYDGSAAVRCGMRWEF